MLSYLCNLAILTGIAVILSVSLNFLIGYAGVFSMAHAAFYGIGAYAGAIVAMHWTPELLVVLPISIIGCAVLSLAISLPALRVRGEYFVVASLGLQVIAVTIMEQWHTVTGGSGGLSGIPLPTVFGHEIDSMPGMLAVTVVCTAAVVGVVAMLVRSSFGRNLLAIRDDEVAARAFGKNVPLIKTMAVAIASSLCSIGGVLYAFQISFVNPESFTINESVLILAMVIIGGTGTLIGPIIGAVLIQLLPVLLSWLPLTSQDIGAFQQILYGAAMVALMLWRPAGLLGNAKRNPA
jgi:branched-chain amino acid transport system permease protein